MNWEDEGKKLVDVLKPVYNPRSESKLFKSIISALYINSFDIDDAEKVVMSIYDNLPEHRCDRTEIFKLMDSIFLGEEATNGGISSLEDVLTVDYGNKSAHKAVKKIEKILNPITSMENFQVNDNSWIRIDFMNNEVNYESVSLVKNERVVSSSKVLLCRPYKVIVHEDPLYDGQREFTITWITVNNTYFTTRKTSISAMESQLYDSGYVVNQKNLKTAMAAVIQLFVSNNLAEIQNEIQAKGFYLNKNGNLVMVDYDLKPLVKSEVESALDLIEDLRHFFVGHEDKLATTLKHGLIAPFGFAKKQMGLPLELLIPYLYHFGKAGSGKTTIARIGLWFYDRPQMDMNDIGGTEFDTVPRIGEQLRKSTFGLLVNEPETSLQKKSCAATLKTAVERTNARQRISGNRMEHILALSTVSFASNIPLPNVEGLPRRFVQILYSYDEKKTNQQKEAFMSHFKLNSPDECEFNKLTYLANFAVAQIDENIDLLKLNWKDFGNELISQAYDYIGREVPLWLLQYVESVTEEDLDDEEVEDIRIFFLNEINKKASQIKVYSAEDGNLLNQEMFFSEDVKTSEDFEERVWNVLNEGLIPYMVTRENREGIREVCFLNGLKKALNGADIPCYSIPSTAELLGWGTGYTKINNKSTRCMKINFRTFVRFLYPSLEGLDD